MSNNQDTFANRVATEKKFSTTSPTTGDLDVDFGKCAVYIFHKMEGCGHCVKFAPIWQKVAEAANNGELTRADGKPIIMAIVDPEHPLSQNVRGFPTIRKYNSNNPSDGVEFEGRTGDARQSEQNLIQFVSN
jgi:thiol-disulfide isomerase/thioredoxin